jgi:hypothetical protein
MPVVQGIRYRNKFFIPAIISSLVAPDQQDRTAPRVESKEHSIGPSRMLYPKFFHIWMARRVNEVGMGTWKSWAHFLKQDHLGVHAHLFSFAQPIPPAGELVCIFDLLFHRRYIAYRLCFVKKERERDRIECQLALMPYRMRSRFLGKWAMPT